MKAQKRHELHTNFLADRLGRILQSMKGGNRSTASVLGWTFLILALATYALWQYSEWASQGRRSEQWMVLSGAVHDFREGNEKLSKLAVSQRGTIPGRTARFEVARLDLQQGEEELRLSRSEGIKNLVEARKLYKELSGECVDCPILAQEALMGIAKAEESLIGISYPIDQKEFLTNLPQARLESLSKIYRNRPIGKAAASALNEIRNAKDASKKSGESKETDPSLKGFVDDAIDSANNPVGMAASSLLDDIFDENFHNKSLGSLDRALEYYGRLVRDFPQSPLGEAAAKRVDEITSNRKNIEDFYAELNQLAVSKPKSKLAGDQSPLTEGSTDTKGP
jgi:hypothetical protein